MGIRRQQKKAVAAFILDVFYVFFFIFVLSERTYWNCHLNKTFHNKDFHFTFTYIYLRRLFCIINIYGKPHPMFSICRKAMMIDERRFDDEVCYFFLWLWKYFGTVKFHEMVVLVSGCKTYLMTRCHIVGMLGRYFSTHDIWIPSTTVYNVVFDP